MDNNTVQSIVVGGGCFWCTEAVFRRVKGIVKVTPGYAGGHTIDLTYQQVCTGVTGHVEVIQLEFDPNLISLEDILEIFFETHDPTTLNRQGQDVGTQYRLSCGKMKNKEKLLNRFFRKCKLGFLKKLLLRFSRSIQNNY